MIAGITTAILLACFLAGSAWVFGKRRSAEFDAAARLTAMKRLGVPYSDDQIAGSAEAVKGKTEMDAIVAYLQSLGTHVK